MTTMPLLDDAFLRAQWADDYAAFAASPEAAALEARLRLWAAREQLSETESEAAFIQRFFCETWGYTLQGADSATYTCRPQFAVARAGQSGHTGAADIALGHFGAEGDAVPQVLGEFKDIRSGLDAPQRRKGNSRSPVEQAFDYLHEAYNARSRDALTTPSWVVVTDMREFRLYARLKGRAQCQRFILAEEDPANPRAPALLGRSEAAAFRRFAFWRIFRPDMLLAQRGASPLDALLRDQLTREKDLEARFYSEYRAYRDQLYQTIRDANPDFPGTRGKLVRLTQRLLDRCIFILFCEDMGRILRYPPELLRDILIEHSTSRFYNPEGSAPWDALRALFRAMDTGGDYGDHRIERFNGGLFRHDPELESLRIPARVFCAKDQGRDGDRSLLAHPLTLLYFSAAYNFGLDSASGSRAIGLYTLGRIFEQSITELEIMEAEADGRESLNRLTKRKTDGVYYTPEWVTAYIVEHTLGTRLADIRRELGYPDLPPLDDAAIAEYRAYQTDRRKTARAAGLHRAFLDEYRDRLHRLRIVDPACGSGAFLIQALNRLLAEYRWIVAEQERLEGAASLFDQDAIIRSILSHNIYGVDINPESVEITRLALWLHTASPGQPLTMLDTNIRCGNSLVGPDFAPFYQNRHQTLFLDIDEEERERINAFDWTAAFPEVFAHGGFDCVIGNPPYIKLQHFRRAQDDVAAYLATANTPDGAPVYRSTRSGNFDMYLPFIEKGLALLRPEGRMGYIAPNVWMVNEYGQPLRDHLRKTRQLDRWLDFKSHQIFDEAITYTALQFFRAQPAETLTVAFAPDGNTDTIDWDTADQIPYNELPENAAWTLAPQQEKRLLDKLAKTCTQLGDPQHTQQIFQGLVTSADKVYHLKPIAPNRYTTHAGEEVPIEDALMHPLVSGPEAKRYQNPQTDTYLLFPYKIDEEKPRLYTPEELQANYPLAWNYLCANEETLRGRENGKMNDDTKWWGYVYPKNLDKHEFVKLLVPRLAIRLFCAMDTEGGTYLDNVDVGGILAKDKSDLPFLAAIINCPVSNFYWRRTSKPFANDYRSANKQFIAPLPIPNIPLAPTPPPTPHPADQSDRSDRSDHSQSSQSSHSPHPSPKSQIADYARALQGGYTQRRDLIAAIDNRLASGQVTPLAPTLGPDWLWAEVGTPTTWRTRGMSTTSKDKKGASRRTAAEARALYAAALEERLVPLDNLLQPGARLAVHNTADELTLLIDGIEALHLYDKPDTPFIAMQWRHALRDLNITPSFDAKRLLRLLLDLRTTADTTLRDRLLALDAEITTLDASLATQEQELNAILYKLYNLTEEEIALVERG